MLYNGTTLNKALLLDWPITLCVHLLDLLQPHNFQLRERVTEEKGAVTELEFRLRLSLVAALFLQSPFH